MSKYLEFVEIPFEGKTKRFEILSKTSFDLCIDCEGRGVIDGNMDEEILCGNCQGTGKINIVLGTIAWYSQWRQYCFIPMPKTVFNRTCMEDIIFFITNLMRDRKVTLMKKDL